MLAPKRIRGLPPVTLMMMAVVLLLGLREYYALRARLGAELEEAQATIAEMHAQLQQSKRMADDCHGTGQNRDGQLKKAQAELQACHSQQQTLTEQLKAARVKLVSGGAGEHLDGAALAAAGAAGAATLQKRLAANNLGFLRMRFGKGPVRIRYKLRGEGVVLVETAPFEVMPHALYHVLTLVDAGFYDGCGFVRNAGHVMQVGAGWWRC